MSFNFLSVSERFKPIRITGPLVGGTMATKSTASESEDESFEYDSDYAREFQERENNEALAQASGIKTNLSSLSIKSEEVDNRTEGINDVEDFTTVTYKGTSIINDNLCQIYKNYNFNYNCQEDLPINSMKEKIVSMVESNQVVVIEGATGCGKSTQVPQFILDSYRIQNKPCNIVVTQPRRIAAMSIARRVADQRHWPLGSVVGYQIGLNREIGEETILTFMTTGVLLQKLISSQNLNEFTHIILDEVHERNKDMDFLMLVVRKFLRTNSRNVKVILMSATINIEKFSQYFSVPIFGALVEAPVITIQKRSKHQTQIFYLEELDALGPQPEIIVDNPTIEKEMYQICAKLIKVMDRLDTECTYPGTVLVFLPGIHEIEELDGILKQDIYKSSVQYEIIPLHSTITTEEQRKVFIPPREGIRKVILSTNIAESSITVPDIKYVIDFCLTKDLQYDTKTTFTCLQLNWAAKTNCKQRAGRAGRVADGRVYRLVPKYFYDDYIKPETVPEMLRCPLDILILLTKRMNLDRSPKEILALALDPPRLDQIERTMLVLKEVGALLLTYNGEWCKMDGDLTYFGHVMAMLPLDIKLTKMIILGYLFSCLEDAIIMAAGMSTKNVFSTPFKEGMNAYNSKLSWADGSCSDLIAILNVYKVWRNHTQGTVFTTNTKSKREQIAAWGRRHYLQHRVLDEMHQLILEIKTRLKSFNIIEHHGGVQWKEIEKPLVLKVVICGAFYPNYFVHVPNQIDEREAVKTLGGRTPNNTVYLQGFDSRQPGPLYASAIKKEMQSCGTDMIVSFDCSNKVYIQFRCHERDPASIRDGKHNFQGVMPGNVALEVYRAVRRRQLYKGITIPILPVEEALSRAKKLGLNDLRTSNLSQATSCTPELPGLEISLITIRISHVIDPGHFWVQNVGFQYDEILSEIGKILSKKLIPVTLANVVVGEIYAAPFEGAYYRVRCIGVIPLKNGKYCVQVFYVDYGNISDVPVEDLRILPPDLLNYPAQAYECVLCQLKPSILLHNRAEWTDKAHDLFYNLTHDRILLAKVYSVTQGIVSIELLEPAEERPSRINKKTLRPMNGQVPTERSINQILLDNGYATPSEESYLSKWNHEMREAQLNMEKDQREKYNIQQAEYATIFNALTQDVPSPTAQECRRKLTLRGPFSPLETRVYGVNVSSHGHTIRVDPDSVNTVLLDSEPQDSHERLLVASSVTSNQAGTNLTLRYTTLMPNLHGFSALMALLFCYKMELRTTDDGTKYAAALCGLGYDKDTNRSLFRDHDILINIDVDLTTNDINLINSLRYFINAALYLEDSTQPPYNQEENFAQCQRNIQMKLLELLNVQRKFIGTNNTQVHKTSWGHFNDVTILQPAEYAIEPYAIYPLHACIDLEEEARNISYQKCLTYLLNISRRVDKFPPAGVTCDICDLTVLNIDSLRIHLVSGLHKQNCVKFGVNIE
ncbi:probable ATP-dependent RNA helicase spindle-E [Chrysoperla carnea]|uniref:probable ATP-dependent RNA helicase spindle-E n=1 Tax=Chrysoperla carnea TaxID=189513 RepID=UPI001D06ABE0|nr:probable ATP-dependent RNA helicase spindle-E [Chrysoperla carnea]